jgi:lysophospholipase L1-like esterase
MRKNKLHESFILCLIVIGVLLTLYLVPEFSIDSLVFKKIDLLSDIREEAPADTLYAMEDSIIVQQDSVVKIMEEHCKPGYTCIEDYSGDSTALKFFLSRLAETKESGKRMRIAFYGDSFIEGDVFCGGFRDTLQSIFGGRGVGYVPITSAVTGFRNTIKHSFNAWETKSLMNSKNTSLELGPAGYCFIPLHDNWVEYRPSKQRFLREFSTIRFYYTNFKQAAVQYTVNNDSIQRKDNLKISSSLQEWIYHGQKIKSIRFEFDPYDSLYLYGASFESWEGIYVDNFSLRGNSGLSLNGISDNLLRSFSLYRDYKLVILQFGINQIKEDTFNYNAYIDKMVGVVNKMKRAFAGSSFLLLSVADRSSNKSGVLKTMNSVPAMRNAQRTIAEKTQIAFWDMYEAMGGENSMVEFARARPPLAAKDYTHLTFQGGKKLASLLAKSLLYEQEKYERNNAKYTIRDKKDEKADTVLKMQ